MPTSAYKQEFLGHLAIAMDEMSKYLPENIRREHAYGGYHSFIGFNETLYRVEFGLGCECDGLW